MRTLFKRICVSIAIYSSCIFGISRADDVIPNDPQPRWWKGNIHTHSLWSDGNDFPEMIAEWYRTHDYNFLALSDHNVLSEGQRWMKAKAIVKRGDKSILEKYEQRFGGGWVERRGEGDDEEFRLKPLDEFRSLVESRGKFIMIQGEEISDRAEGVPVHMNATNLAQVVPPVGGQTVREAMTNNLRAIQEQADRLGREIVLHLNHPNFGDAVTAEDMAAVIQERFFEVYNGHPGVKHLGDDHHPSVERLWDIANTIRIAKLNAPPLYGVATDDSHVYNGVPGSHTGRGWIMVRSKYLTPEHIVKAIKSGDFYASSGVTLKSITEEQGKLTMVIDAKPGVEYRTEFIGTRRGYDATSQPRTDDKGKPIRTTRKYSADVGTVLATVKGNTPSYEFDGDELYVRAVVTSTEPHPDPSFKEQFQQAWSQPFGWDRKQPTSVEVLE